MAQRLGWRPPKDRSYLKRYSLSEESAPSTAQPVVIGVPWYSSFDQPEKFGDKWWIGHTRSLGFIRGGHAICVQPGDAKDWFRWYYWYDQGKEGACVGYSLSRAVSLMNKKTYDAEWLYNEAQLIDGFDDTPPGDGTTLNAGCKVLLEQGHRRFYGGSPDPINYNEGITKYRWVRSIEEIHSVLKNPLADRLEAIPILNSWGRDFPRKVWLPDDTAERIIFKEDGEAVVLTDR